MGAADAWRCCVSCEGRCEVKQDDGLTDVRIMRLTRPGRPVRDKSTGGGAR